MRTEDAERRFAQIEGERDYYKRMAERRERQRDRMKEALEECFPLAIAWGAHYQFLHELGDMHDLHARAIDKARAALEEVGDE